MVESNDGRCDSIVEWDARQEMKDYLHFAGMHSSPEMDYPVDRSRSIFELIDERKSPPIIFISNLCSFIGDAEF